MNYLHDPDAVAPVPVFGIGCLILHHDGRTGMVVSGSFLLPGGRAYRVDYDGALSGADPETSLEHEMWAIG